MEIYIITLKKQLEVYIPFKLKNNSFYFFEEQSFFYDFKNALIKDYTWESVFRIRATRGWQISKIYGNFIIKSSDLLSVSNIDENKTFIYDFSLMEDASATDTFAIQAIKNKAFMIELINIFILDCFALYNF